MNKKRMAKIYNSVESMKYIMMGFQNNLNDLYLDEEVANYDMSDGTDKKRISDDVLDNLYLAKKSFQEVINHLEEAIRVYNSRS